MGSNPTVSGVISVKLILAAGFIQSILWRRLASCFDLDRFLRVYAFARVKDRSAPLAPRGQRVNDKVLRPVNVNS